MRYASATRPVEPIYPLPTRGPAAILIMEPKKDLPPGPIKSERRHPWIGTAMDTEIAELRRKLEEAERMIAKLKLAIVQAIDMAGTFERHMEIRAVLLVALAGCVA